MNKILFSLCCLLFPVLALASDGSLSFAPPPGDYSVVFLGNIFGIVDGVLHGTGSQIMGTMFGVFNSAVLALGGIIIMYTLMVSTMNTAQEGQMLGQKWSSLWIPVRSTLGLALLIPKASGYCLMQIFVMWVILQGVGAADKIWAAALGYLNRGGVIVQTNMESVKSLTGGGHSIAQGASTILAGQVCMLGLQTALENQRESYLENKKKDSGPCAGSPSGAMKQFCDTAVPDFLSTVNTVSAQSLTPNATNFSVSMPNIDTKSPYASLNGICGSLKWNAFSAASLTNVQTNITSITTNELNTAKMSRAIAIQQMYLDLSMVARVMIYNDPGLNPKNNNGGNTQTPFSAVAQDQFGLPFLSSGTPCTAPSPKCVMWGQDPSGSSAPLFSGTEFQGAIADYNGIMLPTLNLVSQASKGEGAENSRKFIEKANQQGWILAGSYFFDLARLNSSSIASANTTDTDTGLQSSSFDPSQALTAFNNGQCSGTYADLCQWFNASPTKLNQVFGLIDGSSVLTSALPAPDFSAASHQTTTGPGSSTVYGFVNNSIMVNLPNQPGLEPPQFAMKFNMKIQPSLAHLPSINFPCGFMCLGKLFGNVLYNLIFKNLWNWVLDMVNQLVNLIVMSFISLPLLGMAEIFKTGVSIIQQPSVNPVIALANMGVNYINFSMDLWIYLIELTIPAMFLGPLGLMILGLLLLALPLLIAWVGIMVSIGFITAYYVPFLPYMIFTFGSIAWIMAVIEAMVAAPLVALGVTHPEGHDAFGKGEYAIMILMNVFLRPSMMIIGFITAIAVSYVSVWVINAGFGNAMTFIQGAPLGKDWGMGDVWSISSSSKSPAAAAGDIDPKGYANWAGIYGFFFSLLVYTTMYLLVVQKAFTLITMLPDKILRWIGGQPETIGQEASQWGEEVKGKVEKGGEKTSQAQGQMEQKLTGYAQGGASKAGSFGGSQADAQSGDNAESTPDGGGAAEGAEGAGAGGAGGAGAAAAG